MVIEIRDRVAKLIGDPIVSYNTDYMIRFDFDDEWIGYETKTARFHHSAGYTDVVFSGDTVEMPVITDTNYVGVGVFAGNLRTTTPVYIRVKESILSKGGTPIDPPEDVYAQIMDELNRRPEEAPEDGETYGRKDGAWVPVQGGSGEVDYFTVADGMVCAVYETEDEE